ncbi:MAG: G5 domain-containing protein [Clostridia bacterium]|nr:G5 domain-containing protein [Clostridia bacterium]
MLHTIEKLRALWKKVREHGKAMARKALGFAAKHRIPTTAVCGVLVLSMLMSVITVNIHEVTVLEDGNEIDRFHAILTDDETLLEKAGIILEDGDEMNVAEDGGQVTLSIARAFPIAIKADDQTVTVMLASGTVADALAKANITCGASDILSHEMTAPIAREMVITLDRVTTGRVVETESIDYTTKKIQTNDLYVGQTEVQQEGVKGEKKLTYDVTYINGEESDRKLVDEEITKEPVEKIVRVGIKIKSSFKKTASTPKTYKKVIAMEASAYSEGGTTASGLPCRVGVVAVDPRVIPLGTKVYVETADGKYIYGTAIAADTGGAIKGNKIDLCVHTRAEAYRFGRRTVNVYIL